MDLQEAFDAGFDAVKQYVDTTASAFGRRLADVERDIAREAGWRIDIRETGPLSGGFALMTPEPVAAEDIDD